MPAMPMFSALDRTRIAILGAALMTALPVFAQEAVYRCVNPSQQVVYSDTNDVPGATCKLVDIAKALAPPVKPATAGRRPPIRPLSIARGKAILEGSLRDPDSVRYKDVFVSKTGDVCGRMNAKNGYGGYAGYTDFIVRAEGGAPLTWDRDGRIVFTDAYVNHCERRGK